jgi:hypothetical protein
MIEASEIICQYSAVPWPEIRLKMLLVRKGIIFPCVQQLRSPDVRRKPKSSTGADRIRDKWTWECSYRMLGVSDFTLYSICLHVTSPDISVSYCSDQQGRFDLSPSISPFDIKNTAYVEGQMFLRCWILYKGYYSYIMILYLHGKYNKRWTYFFYGHQKINKT